MKMVLDGLHTLLITGFGATITGLVIHALTRWRLGTQFVSLANCNLQRRECALADMATIKADIEKIENVLTEIQSIQRERTITLAQGRIRQERIWRLVLTELKISLDKQDELLGDYVAHPN